MGLASISAIYQARFNAYLCDRGLLPHPDVPHLGAVLTQEQHVRDAATLGVADLLAELLWRVEHLGGHTALAQLPCNQVALGTGLLRS